MQSRQVAMSSHPTIALVQPTPRKSGHVLGQAIDAGGSLSPSDAQSWSAPPHALAMAPRSFASLLAFVSDVQSVVAGYTPFSLPSSQRTSVRISLSASLLAAFRMVR